MRLRADTMKTVIPRIQNVTGPSKKLSKTDWFALTLVALLLAALFWFGSHYETTGLLPLPFLNRAETILPAQMRPEDQTYGQVMDFIRSDDTDTIPYRDGFNCVDAALRIWRNAYWKGITAYLIVIQYDQPPGHMVIAFATNDRGTIIIEPQSDSRIRPRVGQDYGGRQVSGIYALDFDALPLDDSPPYEFTERDLTP